SIDAIADFCGFGSGRALRDHFRSHMKMSMREFRARNRR
ncbi:MAG: AraC family transcriptional regulator, partial [Kiritimatiellae bacterium]|nr:AraC family transcriptional regulator [Kiritimatiellia bacterium]